MTLSSSLAFVATGANRSTCAISWDRRLDRVAFCSGPLIVIGHPSTAQIESVLVGHAPSTETTAVQWVQDGTGRLVSCDADGRLLLWRYDHATYTLLSSIDAHDGAIGHVATLPLMDGSFLVSTSGSEKRVRLWHDTDLMQTITCRALPLCSALCHAARRTLLAIGGVDARIDVYRLLADGGFVPVAVVEGHADWVRDLDWFAADDDDRCLLASASLDRTIRIWSMGADDVVLDAVLDGHDHAVTNATWAPGPILFSASFDKTVMSWRFEGDRWVSVSQAGEVGGHNLACYTVAVSPDARQLLTNTYNGAFYLWVQDDDGRGWRSAPIWSGHASPVAGLAWDVAGRYLLSIGDHDQTTRVYAPWIGSGGAYHEIARPQVHGYDMACISAVPGVRHRFVSAGQEKVLRLFDAPKPFVRALRHLSGVVDDDDDDVVERADGVYLPALSLTNKIAAPIDDELDGPPDESVLAQSTLWPEVGKLYGHGNHLFAVAVSHDGRWMASASTSRDPTNAALLIWRYAHGAWKEAQRLAPHDLTVVQMAFSPDDRYLLSVSRDRSVAVSVRDDDDDAWRLMQRRRQAHARVIWSCAWSANGAYFVTGGRDKLVRAWALDPGAATFVPIGQLALPTAATAVALDDDHLLAVGGEDGRLELWQGQRDGAEWRRLHAVAAAIAHSGAVKQLQWQPAQPGARPLLASCGADHTVRLYAIRPNTS